MSTRKNVYGRFSAALAAALVLAAAPAAAAPSGGAGTGGLNAPAARQVDPSKAYAEGLEALKAEDFRTAEEKFNDVLSVAPKNPEANYYMGIAKIGRGKAKASVRYFERAIKERESFTEARERLALVQIELGETAEADAQLAAMKAQQSACAEATCGEAYVARLGEAVARVEAALAAGPAGDVEARLAPAGDAYLLAKGETGDARYRQAARLVNQARYDDAREALYLALAVNGPHPDILNYLGFTHRKLGRFEEAKAYYTQALAIDPDHRGATEYLGELYLETGDLKRARRQLARLERICAFACAEREDLARLIAVKESDRRAAQ